MVLSLVGVSHAQVDLAKVLVGTWEGEQEYLVISAENPKRILVIESVNQVDGKWVANGRYGTPAGLVRVKIAVETGGKGVDLSWTGPTGNQFQLNLLRPGPDLEAREGELGGTAPPHPALSPDGERGS